MRALRTLFVLGLAVLPCRPAAGLGGIVTDQAVTLAYGSSHWDSTPDVGIAGVDASGDQLYECGWWYRAEGDTREYPLPAPDSETYVGGDITATWNNVDGKGFRVQESTYVFDNEGPSGGFLTYMVVYNSNPTSKDFTLFHYVDMDLASTSTGDSGTLVNSHFLKFSDGASKAAYKANGQTHYKVGSYSTIRGLLNDTSVTTLDDAGLPFGPGDMTAAYQFGPYTYSPNGGIGFNVSVSFNPAHDLVSGDYNGTFLQAPLYGQASDLTGRVFHWMRRTSQLPFLSSFGAPTGNSTIAGVADFNGSFVATPVYRDTLTGVAYVSYSPITGAPTLALNWKLSATGDFNADGKADILWRNTASQKLVIWTMNGSAKTGALVPSPDQAVNVNWEVAGAADFNADGNRDLLWYNQTTGKIVLWYMDASVVRITGLFTTPDSVGNNNWRVLAVGDYGKGPAQTGTPVYDTQDIVWQNDTSKKVVVWHMDQAAQRTGGVFTAPDTLYQSYDVVGPR